MEHPEEDPDDDVGFGKPPKKFQFQKGQSGNPNGRPKKIKTRKQLLAEAWGTEVTVNGKRMTMAQAFVISLVTDGVKGKASARNLLMNHLPEEEDGIEDFDPNMDDQTAYIKLIQTYSKRPPEKEKEGDP